MSSSPNRGTFELWLKLLVVDPTAMRLIFMTGGLAVVGLFRPTDDELLVTALGMIWVLCMGLLLYLLLRYFLELPHILDRGLWVKVRVAKWLPRRHGMLITGRMGDQDYNDKIMTHQTASGRELRPSEDIWLRCNPVSRVCHPAQVYRDDLVVPVEVSQNIPEHWIGKLRWWPMLLHDPWTQLAIGVPLIGLIFYFLIEVGKLDAGLFWMVLSRAVSVQILALPVNRYKTLLQLVQRSYWVLGQVIGEKGEPTLIYTCPVNGQTITFSRRLRSQYLMKLAHKGVPMIVAVNPVHPHRGMVISPYLKHCDVAVFIGNEV